MKWFETWFDSPYYHLLYAHRSPEEADNFIRTLVNYLHIPFGAKVLDAACGKGRHACILAKLNLDVTGIDLSKNSIEFARSFESEHLRFAVYDIREVYKPGEFDYVFNMFSSFGYFDDDLDDERTLKAFSANLKPSGTLILDYINTETAVKHMKPREIIQRGDVQFHVTKKLEGGFMKKKIEFLVGGENYLFEEQLKIINLFKFEKMLKTAGLQLIRTFGNYELSEFASDSSPRLILIAQKL